VNGGRYGHPPVGNTVGFFSRILGLGPGKGHTVEELARRLGLAEPDLRAVPIAYRTFRIGKKGGGFRTITAPDPPLKQLQRRICRRVLARLPVHRAVRGFEPGQSIVTNAASHTGQRIVLQLDIQDFFASTQAEAVESYFRRIGWTKEAARLLRSWCTHDGGLPQGAPTSPRLSNLVNYRLDSRLAAMAAKVGASYTRYADDLTFSFAADDGTAMRRLLFFARHILREAGYRLHVKKKCHIRRRHQRQIVTGLVVNERPRLPRDRRRWLRAVAHRLATGRPATLTQQQVQGWRALEHMVESQWQQLQR
jgi:RNA-directed DNA polymerase